MAALSVVAQGVGNPQEGQGKLGRPDRPDTHFEAGECWVVGGEAPVAGGEGPGAGGGGWVAGLGAASLGVVGLEVLPCHRQDDLGSLGMGQAR